MLQIANGILGRDKAHGEQWYQGKVTWYENERKGKKKMKGNAKKGKGQLLFVDGCQSYNFNYADDF